MNSTSSRSHAILTLECSSSRPVADGAKMARHARLDLVDLAGSERQEQATRVGGAAESLHGSRFQEASLCKI